MDIRKEILHFLHSSGGTAKKSEITKNVTGYYQRTPENLQAVLSRMVDAGLIHRPKIGWYAIGGQKKNKPSDENQTKLDL